MACELCVKGTCVQCPQDTDEDYVEQDEIQAWLRERAAERGLSLQEYLDTWNQPASDEGDLPF